MNNNQKISVLHLISSAAFLGAERVVCELASNIDPDHYYVQVGILGSSDAVFNSFKASLDGSAAELVYVPCEGKLSITTIKAIQNHIRHHNTDILHAHGYKSDLYGFLAVKLARSGTRLVATNHTWKLRTFLERLYKLIDKTILHSFNSIVAVSDEVKAEMIKLGIDGSLISIIYNGVSVSGYDVKSRTATRQGLGLAEHELVIGCVASLTEEKAHADLIRSFAILHNTHPHVRLVLVGDGPEFANLVSMSEQLGVRENICFTGQRQDVKSLYVAFDLFALVSYAEGLPMAMLEAMAASLPVVVSAVGAIPQVVTSMVNGILITPGDIDTIANSFIKLLQEPALRELLGRNARSELVANYSVSRMSRDYEQLYAKVMASNV
ncbi:MAG: glycosyltransferase [Deltaproteobacteria bacterium]|nr:glycosyltransferase [Deltaproteobacteria bacterium]